MFARNRNMISMVRGTPWMRTLATVLEEEVYVVRDLIRGIQEYVHMDVCQLVERFVIDKYPIKDDPKMNYKEHVEPGCFLFHSEWKEWVFAVASYFSSFKDILVSCSSFQSPVTNVNWLAGKRHYCHYDYDQDEHDYSEDGMERQVEYIRERDQYMVIQVLQDVRGMMVDKPTGELLILDDDKIRLVRRRGRTVATIVNLFCWPYLHDHRYRMRAFWMDSSTCHLYVLYDYERIESDCCTTTDSVTVDAQKPIIQKRTTDETTADNHRLTDNHRFTRLAVLQRKQAISNKERWIYELVPSMIPMTGRYSPTLIPTSLVPASTILFSGFSTVSHCGVSGDRSIWVQQTWRRTTTSLLNLVESRYIVNHERINFSDFGSLNPDGHHGLIGLTAPSTKAGTRELILVTANESEHHPSANLVRLMDPFVVGCKLNDFNSLFVCPDTHHVYLTTSIGQILVMGDLTQSCHQILPLPNPCYCSSCSDSSSSCNDSD